MIIGINEWGHDISLAAIEKEKITLAIEEERISRKKHHFGLGLNPSCPLESKSYLKKYQRATKVSCWTIGNERNTSLFVKNKILFYHGYSILLAYPYKINKYIGAIGLTLKTLVNNTTLPINRKIFCQINDIQDSINHHLAHAASAYRCSPFKKANVLVLDSSGEKESASIYYGNKNLECIKKYDVSKSLGSFYGFISHLLNLGIFSEGKMMGLSSYGRYNKKFANLLYKTKGSYELNMKKIKALFKYRRPTRSPITQDHKDMAYMVQKQLEDIVLSIVEETYKKTKNRKWCIAGGVGLNCLLNSKILRSKFVDDIFVQPAASDSGAALGAAMEYNYEQGGASHIPLKNAYLGPEFSQGYVQDVLERNNMNYKFVEDIESTAADHLAKNYVIGWFQGRMEFGPRALGNRSILANPMHEKNRDIVNDIKLRERWRPLAPSILWKDMKEYYYDPYPSPFMNLSFQTRKEKIKEIPAVVHVDGSARVQTVTEENGRYFNLLKRFKEKTGIPLVLNTSFNSKGEPIVMTPEDAIAAFSRMKIDILIINNFLIKK